MILKGKTNFRKCQHLHFANENGIINHNKYIEFHYVMLHEFKFYEEPNRKLENNFGLNEH